jgi:hypothetical protein
MNEKEREEIAALVKQMIEEEEDLSNPNTPIEKPNYRSEEYINYIRSVAARFIKKEKFQLGQLVQWKENLQNRILPEEGQPAIVLKVLDEPIIHDNKEPGSPYFGEPLDIVLGVLDSKNRFITLYYDSSRFEVYK